jgi:hypothetical protein
MKRITVSLPDSLDRQLAKESEKYQGNKSMVIKIALENYIDHSEIEYDKFKIWVQDQIDLLERKYEELHSRNLQINSILNDILNRFEGDSKQSQNQQNQS